MGKKAVGAVRGEKDELWVVTFDITRRPADLDSESDPFDLGEKPFFFGSQRVNSHLIGNADIKLSI